MTYITKPLLAGKFEPDKALFPLAASPKIDGIRFIMKDGVALSRSLKPIRNEFIQSILSALLPDGVDGELTSGDTFQSCGEIMRIKGQPDFRVWLFDYLEPGAPMKGYLARIEQLMGMVASFLMPNLVVLEPTIVNNQDELDELAASHLEQGYEGTMVRRPNGIYKMGRSTTKEGILLKLKPFEDSEATIIGFQELLKNENPQTTNALGLSERSTEKAGMVPQDTLGAFIVEWDNGVQFNCGSGLNDTNRKEIWNDKDSYLGRTIKFKYQAEGVLTKPRLPIFLGFRDGDDIS